MSAAPNSTTSSDFRITAEAVGFLSAVGVFIAALALVFLFINKMLCFSRVGGAPCLEQRRRSRNERSPGLRQGLVRSRSADDDGGRSSSDSDNQVMKQFEISVSRAQSLRGEQPPGGAGGRRRDKLAGARLSHREDDFPPAVAEATSRRDLRNEPEEAPGGPSAPEQHSGAVPQESPAPSAGLPPITGVASEDLEAGRRPNAEGSPAWTPQVLLASARPETGDASISSIGNDPVFCSAGPTLLPYVSVVSIFEISDTPPKKKIQLRFSSLRWQNSIHQIKTKSQSNFNSPINRHNSTTSPKHSAEATNNARQITVSRPSQEERRRPPSLPPIFVSDPGAPPPRRRPPAAARPARSAPRLQVLRPAGLPGVPGGRREAPGHRGVGARPSRPAAERGGRLAGARGPAAGQEAETQDFAQAAGPGSRRRAGGGGGGARLRPDLRPDARGGLPAGGVGAALPHVRPGGQDVPAPDDGREGSAPGRRGPGRRIRRRASGAGARRRHQERGRLGAQPGRRQRVLRPLAGARRRRPRAPDGPVLQRRHREDVGGDHQGEPLPQHGRQQTPGHVRPADAAQLGGAGDLPLQDVAAARSAQPGVQGDLRLPGGPLPAVGRHSHGLRVRPAQPQAQGDDRLGGPGPEQQRRGGAPPLEGHEGRAWDSSVQVARPAGRLTPALLWTRTPRSAPRRDQSCTLLRIFFIFFFLVAEFPWSQAF
ncbi:translation initiation factor IF-2 isoform X2 [Hippocampus comes]|uniref:translation initiation factor IF-2 isoform X2 n=1 Tax=Hippocampus comes TaxID=109280 RepID=UPI00094EC713|nr:PREDICTED: synaptotagmin-16 isoform X2 [Hippocampus comes]